MLPRASRLILLLCSVLLSVSVLSAQDSVEVRVIVTLRDPVPLTASPESRSAAVAAAQAQVRAALPAEAEVLRAYAQVPALLLTIPADALLTLEANPLVLHIQPDEEGGIQSDVARPAIGVDAVQRDLGLTGAGVRVAVLDSGAALDHPDLATSIVAQACFTGGGSPGAGKCAPNNANTGTNAQDQHGHGTNVAGLISSDGTIAPRGFAPDAELVIVRVLDERASGWLSDWVTALDWIIANQETLRIDVINMSLGTFMLYPPGCDASHPSMARAIDILRTYWGVPSFASSGNMGDPYLSVAPACITNAIGVGATYSHDIGRRPEVGTWRTRFGSNWPTCFDEPTGLERMACFTSGGAAVDLLAPGAYIVSTGLPNPTSRYVGTSQSAPVAAAVAALLLQARPALSPDALEAIMKETGVPIVDYRGNGFTYPRIDALAAAQRVLALNESPVQTAPIARAQTSTHPTLTWTHVPGTEAYYLWLSRASGQRVLNIWVDPAALCDATLCRYEMPFPLSAGIYRWWVQAWSRARGESPWAGMAQFQVNP
jgi:subtilisin family serine protease